MVTLKWFPNSWIQAKTRDLVIYVDPAYLTTYFANYPKRIEFSKWPDPIDGLPEILEPADLILITHHHKDHCKRITVDRLRRPNTAVVAPKACRKELGHDIQQIAPVDEMKFGDIKIKAVSAYNTPHGRSTCKQHPPGKGVGYIVTIEGRTIYHAGDTDILPIMASLGNVNVACLPIGGRFTMDVSEAVEAARMISPRMVVAMHRLNDDPNDFKRRLEQDTSIQVAPLSIGEPIRVL
jgi:L-ascorbate metabolism protein UlaG (beta-lactamase superfamily)